MVDGLSVSRRRCWRPARQRRGRCAIAQPGAAKSVALQHPACAAGCVFWDRRAQPSACENARVALTEGKSPAPKVGASCSRHRVHGLHDPWRASAARRRQPNHREETMEARKGRDGKNRLDARHDSAARRGRETPRKFVLDLRITQIKAWRTRWTDEQRQGWRKSCRHWAVATRLPPRCPSISGWAARRRCMATRCCIALKWGALPPSHVSFLAVSSLRPVSTAHG